MRFRYLLALRGELNDQVVYSGVPTGATGQIRLVHSVPRLVLFHFCIST